MLLTCFTAGTWAGTPTAADYVAAGRAELATQTFGGVEAAYTIFETGLNDAGCPDCAGDRELRFLHALTKTIMLLVDCNDVVVTDSLFELAEAFGVTFTGSGGEDFNAVFPINDANCWVLPPGADPMLAQQTLYDVVLPKVDEIIAELDLIDDSPTPFVIYFTPAETGLLADIEVDTGEVLFFKGLLMAYKSLLEAQIPYDLKIDIDTAFLESLWTDGQLCEEEFDEATLAQLFDIADPCNPSINTDLLDKYPYLLMVSPTPNDPNDGAAILALARDDLVDALTYWLDAIDYIKSEDVPAGTDPQQDELLYFDPNALQTIVPLETRLTALRNSLQNRTVGNYVLETATTYDVYDGSMASLGEAVLIYNFTGTEGEDGWMTLEDGTVLYIDWVHIDPSNNLMIELYSRTAWMEAWFEGTITADRSSITSGTLYYWGSTNGSITGITGQRTDNVDWAVNFDPNPLFGTSPPVNPRDLLPQFNAESEIVPGTFGHGLGDDPTLGGIFPDWYQEDWSEMFDIPALVYRFWSPTKQRHFFTIISRERDKLVDNYSHVWTYENVAYWAYVSDSRWGLMPVYRFWSDKLGGHFYTISTSERDKLIDNYSHVWTFEGEAFYAYPEGQQPFDASPVYRFWSDSLNGHFYTTSESEKTKLIDNYSHVWTFEDVAWYVDNE